VLVNWNNWQDTAECLASLALQDYSNLRVIVVDNGSTNDSVAQLRAAHPWATYIENGFNAGFPKACNLGARHPCASSAEFLWLLNNDTIVPPDTTRKLVETALARPDAGVIGAVLYFAHAPARIQAWGGGSVSLWTGYNIHYTAPVALTRVSYLTFASALIRREAFDRLGGLFEGVFMYFEDADFCLRARAANWQLTVATGTAILHKEGASIKNSAAAQARPRNLKLERLVTSSGMVFLGRHAPVPAIACLLFLLSRVAKRCIRGDLPALRAVLLGFLDWCRNRVSEAP
jgi:GT2 family glycosyltransferase